MKLGLHYYKEELPKNAIIIDSVGEAYYKKHIEPTLPEDRPVFMRPVNSSYTWAGTYQYIRAAKTAA